MDDGQNTPPQPPAPQPPQRDLGNNGGKRKRRIREKVTRFRFVYIWVVGMLVIGLSLLADPDTGLIRQLPFGAGTIATLVILTKGVVYCGLLHFSRKGLMDYFDLEDAWQICRNDPKAAGLYSIGAGLYSIAMALAILAAVTK